MASVVVLHLKQRWLVPGEDGYKTKSWGGAEGLAKAKKTPAPKRLTDEQREEVRAWCEEKFPLRVKRLGDYEENFLLWAEATGTEYASWTAAFKRWVRNNFGTLVHAVADRPPLERSTGDDQVHRHMPDWTGFKDSEPTVEQRAKAEAAARKAREQLKRGD